MLKQNKLILSPDEELSIFEVPNLWSVRMNLRLVLESVLAMDMIELNSPFEEFFLTDSPDSNFNCTSTLSSKDILGLIISPKINRDVII